MKRKQELTPEFDEIIFGNRNKSYGAYDLRKRYKSALSLSILCGITFSAVLMVALTFKPEKGIASPTPVTVTILISDPVQSVEVPPVAMKPPSEPVSLKYLEPEVTENPEEVTAYIPSVEEISIQVKNGNENDSIIYVEPTDPVVLPDPEPRIFVEEMPEFPGGNAALLRFVGEALKYPEEAIINNIQGRVTIKFAVNTNGSVGRIEVIRGIDPLLDNEALRIINTLPHFKPGKQNGVPVPVWFTLPVVFKIKTN